MIISCLQSKEDSHCSSPFTLLTNGRQRSDTVSEYVTVTDINHAMPHRPYSKHHMAPAPYGQKRLTDMMILVNYRDTSVYCYTAHEKMRWLLQWYALINVATGIPRFV